MNFILGLTGIKPPEVGEGGGGRSNKVIINKVIMKGKVSIELKVQIT